jgi:uncharacterized protein (DUF983 family)
MNRIKAIVKGLCSHCGEGKVYKSLWKINETCSVCGTKFEREYGYFLMSIFMGYIYGFLAILPAMIILLMIGDIPLYVYLVVAVAILLLLSPIIIRLSRMTWLHIDELLDPREDVIDWQPHVEQS